MYQRVPSSEKSLQLHLLLTTCNLTTCYNIFFNYYHRGSTLLSTRIIEPSTHRAFTCSNSTIKTLEQGVKYVQS